MILPSPGTTPEGSRSEQEASRWVRSMFGRVAPRYDLANHLLSVNIDRYWRNRTVSRVRDVLMRPQARVLDLACGTGDLLIALEREAGRELIGSDFCHPMLTGARTKLQRGRLKSVLVESDALALPFPDAESGPDHDRIRIPQSGELSRGAGRDAARSAARRRAGDSRIHAAAEQSFRVSSTTGIPAMCCRSSAARSQERRRRIDTCPNRCASSRTLRNWRA